MAWVAGLGLARRRAQARHEVPQELDDALRVREAPVVRARLERGAPPRSLHLAAERMEAARVPNFQWCFTMLSGRWSV